MRRTEPIPAGRARPRAPATGAGFRQSRGRRPRCRDTPPRRPTARRTGPRRRHRRRAPASEVAGYGVPSGAATTLVPMPTTTASRPSATASASSRMPASFCPPGQNIVGPFQRKLHVFRSRRSQRRFDADLLQRRLERQPRGKAERRRHRGRYIDDFEDAAGKIATRRDPGAIAGARAPRSAPWSRTRSARARRRGPAPWLRHWSSRCVSKAASR